METSSRVMVIGEPLISVEKVPVWSSCTASADDISLIRLATAFTLFPNFGPMTLKFAVAVLRTIGAAILLMATRQSNRVWYAAVLSRPGSLFQNRRRFRRTYQFESCSIVKLLTRRAARVGS